MDALSDQSFATQMTQSGLAEVQIAHLAEKSKNEKIVAFARTMIEHHTKNNQQLQSIVTALGLRVPSSLSESDAATLQQLQGLSGSACDEAYLNSQVTAHQKMRSLLQQELSDGTTSLLTAYAQATLPLINHHLQMAEELVGSSSPRT
jgi:putative membrane protein